MSPLTSARLALVTLSFALVAACALDFERRPCATDTDCNPSRGERCLETESGLACVLPPLALTVDDTPATVDPSAPTYAGSVKRILDSNCAACHTPPSFSSGQTSFRLDQYDDDKQGRHGAFAMRKLIAFATHDAAGAQAMPPGYKLCQGELDALAQWAEGGGAKGDGTPTAGDDAASCTPADAGTPGSDAGVDPCAGANKSVTLAQVSSGFFDKHCTACHTGSSAPPGAKPMSLELAALPSQINAAAVKTGWKRIVPGDPMQSLVYRRSDWSVLPAGMTGMPQGASQQVPAADVALLKGWICGGARTQ